MRVLFTPVGDTDPVRGYHDGGMLHILRHYAPVDRVLYFSRKKWKIRKRRADVIQKGYKK